MGHLCISHPAPCRPKLPIFEASADDDVDVEQLAQQVELEREADEQLDELDTPSLANEE